MTRQDEFHDIYVRYSVTELTVGNHAFRRVFDLTTGLPRTIGFRLFNAANRDAELASPQKHAADFSLAGYNFPGSAIPAQTDYRCESCRFTPCPATRFDGEHAEISLLIRDYVQGLTFRRCYFVYPELAAISCRTTVIVATIPNLYWHRRDADAFNRDRPPEFCVNTADAIRLADAVTPYRVVAFRGRSDYADDPVEESTPDIGTGNGNLFFAAAGTGDGLFFLQEAPPSRERRDFERDDFRYRAEDRTINSCCWGITPEDLVPGRELTSYRHTLIGFSGGHDGALAAMKQYLHRRFPLTPARHCSVMVNPWGCGRFPALLNEKFPTPNCGPPATWAPPIINSMTAGRPAAIWANWNGTTGSETALSGASTANCCRMVSPRCGKPPPPREWNWRYGWRLPPTGTMRIGRTLPP
ncbi:MAG: hypothetical protein PHQ27_00885 [Victivallales bacterium]|nr:hypothetical protein [Victivallales bacterium]